MVLRKDFVHHFDHHDPELMVDPYPVYRELRERCPVAWSDRHGGFWVISRYAEVYKVAHDPQTFSSREVGIPGLSSDQGGVGRLVPLEWDPPDHTRVRKLQLPSWSPQSVAKLEGMVRAVTGELIDAFIERGACDYATEFARQQPTYVISRLLGIPSEDAPRFNEWVHHTIDAAGYDPAGAAEAGQQIYRYFSDILQARREQPGDDLISLYARTKMDGDYLTTDELLGICFQHLVAGIDTTFSTVASAAWWLAGHPDQRRRLIDDPALVPTAVEEFLRYLAPVSVARVVTRDTDLGGERLQEGQKVLILFPSANRDETEFPDADQVIFERSPNRHLAFGSGIHRCLGSNLARLEVRCALEETLRRFPDYRIADDATITWSAGQSRGIRTLPITFQPGARLPAAGVG